MTHKTAPDVPNGMQKICGRFERWRSSHQGRLPIEKALWASAAETAREHGVFRTATILRLEYGKVKRMTMSAAPVKRRPAPPAQAYRKDTNVRQTSERTAIFQRSRTWWRRCRRAGVRC
jgi:hypothetical protein